MPAVVKTSFFRPKKSDWGGRLTQTEQLIDYGPGCISICIFQFKCFALCSFVMYSMVFCNRFFFQMFCSKHSITFENAYLLSCWFHCVDIFYIKFRFCELFTVINSVTRILLIEAPGKFITIKC